MKPRTPIQIVLLVMLTVELSAGIDTLQTQPNQDIILQHRFTYNKSVKADVCALRLPPFTSLAGVRIALGGGKGATARIRVLNAPLYRNTPRDADDIVEPVEVVKRKAGPEVFTLTFDDPVAPPHGWCYIEVERVRGDVALLTSKESNGSICTSRFGEVFSHQLLDVNNSWKYARAQFAIEPLTVPLEPDGSRTWVLDTVVSSLQMNATILANRYMSNILAVEESEGTVRLIAGGHVIDLPNANSDTTVTVRPSSELRSNCLLIPIAGSRDLLVELALDGSDCRVFTYKGSNVLARISTFRLSPISRVLSITAADLNSDGYEDLVLIAEYLDGSVQTSTIRQSANESFTAFAESDLIRPDARYVTAGDINGDGLVDLVWTAQAESAIYISYQTLSGAWRVDSIPREPWITHSSRPSFCPRNTQLPGILAGYRRELPWEASHAVTLGGMEIDGLHGKMMSERVSQVLYTGSQASSPELAFLSECSCTPSVVLAINDGSISDITGLTGLALGQSENEGLVFENKSGKVGIATLGLEGVTYSISGRVQTNEHVRLSRRGPMNGTLVAFRQNGVWYSTIVAQSAGGICQDASRRIAGLSRSEADSVIVTWPGLPRRQEIFTNSSSGLPTTIEFGKGRLIESSASYTVGVVPNPVLDQATITLSGPPNQSINVRVSTLDGHLILDRNVWTNAAGQSALDMNLGESSWSGASGTFLVTAIGAGMNVSTRFVVVRDR